MLWNNLLNMGRHIDSMSCGINITADHCVRLYHKDADCSLCSSACPSQAIVIGRPGTGLKIKQDICLGCEKCVGACPQGVFRRSGMSAHEFSSFLLDSSRQGSLTVKCRQYARKAAVSIECLASLHILDLLFLLGSGVEAITLFRGNCSDCVFAKNGQNIDDMVAALQEFVSYINGAKIYVHTSLQKLTISVDSYPVALSRTADDLLVSRREAFNYFRQRVTKTFANTLDIVDSAHSSSVSIEKQRAVSGRKLLFQGILAGLKSHLTDVIPVINGIPAAEIKCTEQTCCHCGLCARLCPSGAVECLPDMPPAINAEKCSGCGICQLACRTDSLKLTGFWRKKL